MSKPVGMDDLSNYSTSTSTKKATYLRKPRTSPIPSKTHGSVDKRGNAGVGVAATGKSAKKSPFYPRKKRT